MAKQRILIAIPTANDIHPRTFRSIFYLNKPEGYDVDFEFFYGYRVDQVRNLIAKWVIEGYDYLFAVDHDMVFEPDTLEKLLSHNKDIVTGLYRGRVEPQSLEVYDLDQRRLSAEQIGDELFEIGGCGFGCVLVARHVLAEVGYPQFEYHPALDHNNTFSEDNDFCKKAMNKGFTIWCDPSIQPVHIGEREFVVDLGSTTEEDPVEHSASNNFTDLRAQKLIPKSHRDALDKLAFDFTPNVIYDVGSCVLHWKDEAAERWPNAKFVCFEAMDHPDLEQMYRKDGVDFVLGKALSDISGLSLDWNCNYDHPGGNSIFDENPEFSPLAEELFPAHMKQQILTTTIDEEAERNLFPMPDLIKMDIQGAELQALKGAENVLKHAKYLIVEAQHVDYNIGAPKVDQVRQYLESKGWVFVSTFGGTDLGVDKDYLFIRDTQVTE